MRLQEHKRIGALFKRKEKELRRFAKGLRYHFGLGKARSIKRSSAELSSQVHGLRQIARS